MAARLLALGLGVALLAPQTCLAQAKAKLAREAAEIIMSKFGKEAAHHGVETLTRKIETLALKHGDEAILAIRKVGPRTFRIVQEAGEHGSQSVKLMARYGDEAVWVVTKPKRLAMYVKLGDNAAEAMMKHGEIAEPLLQSIGQPAAGALKAVSARNGRRLAMMDKNGHLAKIGKTLELLDMITKYGDRAMDYVWRNQGSLADPTALATFLANPEPYLDGAVLPGDVASGAADKTNWTVAVVSALCVIGLLIVMTMWLKHRTSSMGCQEQQAADSPHNILRQENEIPQSGES